MCSIGGNLGTNAGGLCCVKYGQTRDSVLALEVVMADGERHPDRWPERQGRRRLLADPPPRRLAGHARDHHRGDAPAATHAAAAVDPAGLLPDARIGRGWRSRPSPPPGLSPVTLELMDRFTIRAVDDVHQLGLDRDAAAMLMIESDAARASPPPTS